MPSKKLIDTTAKVLFATQGTWVHDMKANIDAFARQL